MDTNITGQSAKSSLTAREHKDVAIKKTTLIKQIGTYATASQGTDGRLKSSPYPVGTRGGRSKPEKGNPAVEDRTGLIKSRQDHQIDKTITKARDMPTHFLRASRPATTNVSNERVRGTSSPGPILEDQAVNFSTKIYAKTSPADGPGGSI